ncbi:MAG: hypothetical protein KKD38_03925, partial [Candidatus Delongbacteria bacterium]|nr:hypothetical protein [Candidatus Delongbacteria bacterium]MCG2760914.1 hypothetical protein [Candidatus Delongbacteria bacterium]
MKDFLFLISFALVYWGYNTDHLLLSVIFAFVLEIHRFIKFRWDFTEKDFNYISMISTIISAGYIIYYVNSTKQLGIISSILQFLPIILFPLNFFYLYSSSTHVNAKRLFLLFVVNKYSVVHPYIRYFRPDYFYFTTVILGGSVKGSINSFYFVVALLIPVLIKFRSRNHSITRFAFSIASVLLLSLIMQSGIYNSFYLLRDFLTDLYIEKFMQNKDRSVQIGNIGSLKDNFRIEIRTEIFHEIRFGILLRDRIFNSYFNGNWTEIDSKNSELKNTMFEYGSFPIDSVRIYFFSRGKTDYIKMPFGTFDFAGIETGKANLNSLGAVSANYTQYLIDYKTYIRKDSLKNLLGNPDESDLKFIKKDSVYTDNLIDALNLKSLDAAQVFSALRNYFIKNYRYSLDYIDW